MIKKNLTLLALCLGAGAAWALDPDVQFQAQARQAEIAPQCAALRAQTAGLKPDARYRKAMCQLFDATTPAERDDALDLLRAAAAEGFTEAQLALADTLQQGTPLQQQEALLLYRRASEAGDIRATLRHARLLQRMQAAADAANAANDPNADPEDSAAARQPGYHCHIYGLGKKVCHGGMD